MAGKPAPSTPASLKTLEAPMWDVTGTRGKIIAGATAAFDRIGVNACTVEDILRSAGISRGTFYQYFRNKEDVLATVFQFSVKMLVERVRTAIADIDEPFRKIERSIDVYLAMQLEQGRLIHGMLVESMRPGSRMAAMRKWALEMLISFVNETIVATQHRQVDPLVYRSLIAGIEGLVLFTQESGGFTPESAARVRSVAIAILERTMALPGDLVPELPTIG